MTLDARIRHDIEVRIRSGEWRPGHRIPTEQQLGEHYGCARATVSKALTALCRAGLVERRKKAGSFVAHPPLHTTVLAVPDIAAIAAAQGLAYRWSVASTRRLVALPDRLRRDWPDPAGAVLLIGGIHHLDDEPVGSEERAIDLATVPDAGAADFAAVAPGSWLLDHVAWSDARHRIRSVGADPIAAHALAVAPGTPCLLIERWTWRSGSPVTYVRQTFRGDRYDLVADFGRQPGSGRP